jgi:hypothetical protein
VEAAEMIGKIAMRKFGAGLHLLLSTSHRSRILFSTPETVTRFKQKERNRKQQDDRE